MPIYAYRCGACGHAKDVLQKLSDPVLDTCPACGAQAFAKQVTAAGFQLKGSGWYVTDFRGGNNAAKAPDAAADGAKEGAQEGAKEGAKEGSKDGTKAAGAEAPKGAAKPAESAAAPSSAPAAPPTTPGA